MLKIEKTHPMEEYLELLRSSTTIYIDNSRLDNAVTEACYTADDYKALTLLELRIESSGNYSSLNADHIIDFLLELGVDLDKRFKNKKTNAYSLDIRKVVDPLIESGVQVELLSLYKKFRSYSTYASFMRSLESQKKLYKATSDGRYILAYTTTIQERENLRVYYRDIAVVSIPKLFSNIVTTPSDEYYLAWCDYPQADWRFAYNLFIKDETNVDIMRNCEDTYEGLARIVEGNSFDMEVFKDSRKAYKVSCLSTFYNSHDKRPIPTAMRNYFNTRKKYQRYVYDLRLLQKFRLPVPCESYFGHVQLLPEASYEDAFLSKGLNTPIQTFTSHIVNETVFGILEKFWNLGYTKEDINIYFVRHDEPIFMFRESIIKDAWIFKDCSQIHIDGFTPIKLDFHFGKFYQEEDEDLTSRIATNAEAHEDRISYYDEGEPKDYYPIPHVESVYVQFFKLHVDTGDTFTRVIYHNYRDDSRFEVVADMDDNSEALHTTLPEAIAKLGDPKYLLIYNDGISIELDSIDTGSEDGTLIKVISRYDGKVVQMNT